MNIKKEIFAFPKVKEFFSELGVENKYISELMELFEYQYVEEGDEIVRPGDPQENYYIVLDGVVDFSIDLLSPAMALEANVVRVAEELGINPGELAVRVKNYRVDNCLTMEELRERKVREALRARLARLFVKVKKSQAKKKSS